MRKKSSSKSKKKGGAKKQKGTRTFDAQFIVKDDNLIKGISNRKRIIKPAAQPFLVENPDYKFADLLQAKEEWSKRILWPSMGRDVDAPGKAVSYNPLDNVVGIGIGEKIAGGMPTGFLCVKFLVRSKKGNNLIAPRHRLPKTIDGIPVDVEQSEMFYRLSANAPLAVPNPKLQIRPAQPGCSIGFAMPGGGSPNVGTFGALTRNANGLFILSNSHVLAGETNPSLGTTIVQPGTFDDRNTANHQLGTLASFSNLRRDRPNLIDGAVARVTNPNSVSNSILFIGPPRGAAEPTINMSVHKFGRSTGYTVGTIRDIEVEMPVRYRTGVFLFQRQILIESDTGAPFAEEGDSGALVLERGTQRAVGLLIARAAGTTALANHISDVLSAFHVTLA